MLGDDIRAKTEIGQVVPLENVKKAFKWMSSKTNANTNVESVIKSLTEILTREVSIKKSEGFESAAKHLEVAANFLSKRPYTTYGSNFVALVKQNMQELLDYVCIESVKTQSIISSGQVLKYPKKVEDEFKQYLKTRKKHKSLGDKMRGTDADKLKIIVDLLGIYLMKAVAKHRKEYADMLSNDKIHQEARENFEKHGQWICRVFCEELESVKITKNIRSIPAHCFFNLDNLKTVILSGSVECVCAYAFAICKNLEEVNIGDSVTEIHGEAFARCKKLKKVTLSSCLESIRDGVFEGCSSLTGITIPDGVKSIMKEAFGRCSSLRTVTIPSSVESIGEDAFKGCPKNMKIEGDASDEIKSIIRRQIGAEQ